MADLKTKPTIQSVENFLVSVEPESKRQDCQTILKLMEKVSKKPAKMWGPAIIGFDQYHYKYESGREGDFFRIGFSPRKQNITIYTIHSASNFPEIIAKLGKHKISGSCLHIKNLSDIDLDILEKLFQATLKYMAKEYPQS